MKIYTREQLKKRFIISCVLSVPFVIYMIYDALVRGDTVALFEGIIGGILFMPLMFMTWSLNLGKILLGFIAPIPILSFLIETCKGIFYAIKAIIVIIKKQEYLKIGTGEADISDENSNV